MQAYNDTAPADRQIRVGDYIVQVNSDCASAVSMSDALQASERLQVMLVRAYIFTKRVRKDGQPLGLDLKYAVEGSSLLINDIREDGAVKRSCPDIHVGDRIVAVNGAGGGASDLMTAIRASDAPQLWLSRRTY